MAEEEPTPEEIEHFKAKVTKLEELARKLGLYMDRVTMTDMATPLGTRWCIVADFTIGDVAFVKRVQDPEQAKIDKQFKQMTHGMGTDEFLELREQMKKNIEEGRNPLDKGDGK